MSGELANDVHPGHDRSDRSSPGVEGRDGSSLGSRTRLLSATAFAGAMFAFALPFGVVSSCDGEEVRFTGAQLATFDVPPDDPTTGTLHTEVEGNAGGVAALVLLLALLGLTFAIGGVARGGVFAALGLVAAQLLAIAILASGDSGASLFEGFWLMLVSLTVAGVVHLVAAARARRRSGRRVWGYVLRNTVLTLLPTLGLIGLIAVVILGEA
jgi:hypothetical protein